MAIRRRTGFLDPVRERVEVLERRVLGDDAGPVARRTFNRGLSAVIVGFLGMLILAPLYGFSVAAILAWLVFVVLYVPPWEVIPRVGRFVRPLLALSLAATYPFYALNMFTIPIFGAFPDVATGVKMLVFAMMAIGLNIVVGYAGLLDLGYVAFYAIGSYTVAWFASIQFAHQNIHFWPAGVPSSLPGIHISIWLLLALAGILTAIVGVIIGLPTLRLRGDYLAIVTLGFGEIMPQVARNGDDFFGTGFNLTNGPNGITPIDSPGFGSFTFLAGHGSFFTPDRLFFWTAILLVLFTVFCSLRLRDSRLGRAWIAIREDETAAAAMGVPLMRTKTWAYAAGAFFGGIAGGYYASFKSATFPGDFFFNISVLILCMVILGGMGNIWGVMVGALFLEYLDSEGLANTGAWLNSNLGLNIDVPKYEFGIFGLILVVVMLFRPQGLIPSARRKAEFEVGVHDEPLYNATHG
ncbi:MAG: branched-chain amino acid ABC transporter permease [Actinobacteria bacterium]|nr:branched-chain amino acid ABC transporter permease [Actinomycetota bacterium]